MAILFRKVFMSLMGFIYQSFVISFLFAILARDGSSQSTPTINSWGFTQSPNNIGCECNASSTQCSWSRYAPRYRGEIISIGTTRSDLMWKNYGYGQYICIRDNSTIVRNEFIIPRG